MTCKCCCLTKPSHATLTHQSSQSMLQPRTTSMVNPVCCQRVSFLSCPAHYTTAQWIPSFLGCSNCKTPSHVKPTLPAEWVFPSEASWYLSRSGFGCSWWLTVQGRGWLPVWDILPPIPSEREGINPESSLHLFKSSATVPWKLLHYCWFYDSPCPSQSSKAYL